MKRLNGVFLSHRKHTENLLTEVLPLPPYVRIPMQMHMGAPCRPIVHIGDSVSVGTQIGEPVDNFGVPIHASVSGMVKAVEDYLCQNGTTCAAIVIESDGEQKAAFSAKPPQLETREDLIAAAKASGCVGLGGAGFPTHIKLASQQTLDTLVVNAAECEPYLTSDCRQIVEAADEVLNGILLIMRLMKLKQCCIGIEENKAAAIKKLAEICAEHKNIRMCVLPSKYPQGAEKVMTYHTTGRVIPEGKFAADVGVLVMNVSTCAFLYRYSVTGMPLVERRITVDGDAVKRPCNLMVPIGTPYQLLLDYAGCDYEHLEELICGGPMMGMSLMNLEKPVCKPNNGLLAMKKAMQVHTTSCIRCGRCMAACPMNLMPMELERAYQKKDVEMLRKYRLNLCMNCGCCSYVCPAKRPLAETNQLAKALLTKV